MDDNELRKQGIKILLTLLMIIFSALIYGILSDANGLQIALIYFFAPPTFIIISLMKTNLNKRFYLFIMIAAVYFALPILFHALSFYLEFLGFSKSASLLYDVRFLILIIMPGIFLFYQMLSTCIMNIKNKLFPPRHLPE